MTKEASHVDWQAESLRVAPQHRELFLRTVPPRPTQDTEPLPAFVSWRLLVPFVLLAVFASSAFGQRAILQQQPDGKYLGVVFTPAGAFALTDVLVLPADPIKPPPSKVVGPVWTIVIRQAERQTADQAEVLLNLRTWSDQQDPNKVVQLEFAPNGESPDGVPDKRVAAWTAKIPKGAKMPYVFIARNLSDGSGSVVSWQGELPVTGNAERDAQSLIDRIQTLLK